jgi:hypothetical protein
MTHLPKDPTALRGVLKTVRSSVPDALREEALEGEGPPSGIAWSAEGVTTFAGVFDDADAAGADGQDAANGHNGAEPDWLAEYLADLSAAGEPGDEPAGPR